jgi:hypothetical protein
MCCHQCSLHHICANWIINNDIHQGPKVVFADKDIHLSLSVMKEKMEKVLLNMCSTLQSNSYDNIVKYIEGCCMLTPTKALKQMGI